MILYAMIALVAASLGQGATVVWLIVATGFLSIICNVLFDIYEEIKRGNKF